MRAALTSALVDSELLDDAQNAALWFRQQLKDVGTPACSAAAALGVLNALPVHGVELEHKHFSMYSEAMPGAFQAAAPGWAAAMHIDSVERAMRGVIETAGAAGSQLGNEAPSAVQRQPQESRASALPSKGRLAPAAGSAAKTHTIGPTYLV